LLWASQADNISGSASHFGYLTSILYFLVGYDIAHFRLLGIVVILFFSLILANSLDGYWSSWNDKGDYLDRASTYILIVGASLSYYGQWWLLTPSYNWLALLAAMLVATGLLYSSIKTNNNINLYIGGLILGVGGALAFIAKPTTAVVLALSSFLWIVLHFNKKKLYICVAISICVAILLILSHAIINFHGVRKYIHDLSEGIKNAELLLGGHDFLGLSIGALSAFIEFIGLLASVDIIRVVFVGAIILITINFLPSTRRKFLASHMFGLILVFCCLIWWLILFTHSYHPNYKITSSANVLGILNHGTLMLSLFFLFILAALPIKYHSIQSAKFSNASAGYFRMLALILLLIVLTFAYAFGTGNDIFQQMSGSTVFISAGMFYLGVWLSNERFYRLVPSFITLMMMLTVLSLIQNAYKSPYRLIGSISEQREPIVLMSSTGLLYVDINTASYVNNMQNNALAAGWKRGMPLIDLTGATPGAVLILDGRIIGQPWLLGGYPGSDQYAKKALNSVSRDILEKAWVLTGPSGLNSNVLNDLGFDFPSRYEQVMVLITGHRNDRQILWRPISFR